MPFIFYPHIILFYCLNIIWNLICTITLSHIKTVFGVRLLAEILPKGNIKNLKVFYAKELKLSKAQENGTI